MSAAAGLPPLIPHPAVVRDMGITMDLPAPLIVYIPEPAAELRELVSIAVPSWDPPEWGTPETATLVFADGKEMPEEAYTLQAKHGRVVIRASGEAGWRNGWQTFLQLAEPFEGGIRVPSAEMEDAPRFAWRGLMLDSSRHIQSVEAIQRLLDQMAMLKLNRFHWHLTDNNGWRIEIPSHPRLTAVGGFVARGLEKERNGYYTQADLRRVSEYARARGIEVIPEIDVPGHAAALAEAYPEFLCPTNRQQPPVSRRGNNSGYHEIICVANDSFYDFIRTVFQETRAATGCARIHIGGDEVEHGIWSACPLCSARMKELGIRDETDYQNHFLSRIGDILKELGMESVYWIERTDRPLPRVTLGQSWRGNQNQLQPAVARGMRVIESSGKYAYFDYPDRPDSPKSQWMPVLPLERVYTHPLVPSAIPPEHVRRIQGGEATLWTEEVLEADLDTMLFPRILALAEQLWSPDSARDWADFQARLKRLQPAWERRGLSFSRAHAREGVPSMIPGARIESTAGFHRSCWPEYVFDGRDTTAYISDRNGVAGDSITLRLGTPLAVRRIAIITGGFFVFDEKNGALQNGMLDVSADGDTWEPVGRLDEIGQADLRWDQPRILHAVRVRVGADMSHRMVVNELILQGP